MRVGDSSFLSWLFPGLMLQFVTLSFQRSCAYHWIKGHLFLLLPTCLWWILVLFRGSQSSTPISIRALPVVVKAGLKNQFLIPMLAPMHFFPECCHWLLLGEGGRENWAIFQKNKYGLFVFVFASTLNSDCILCLDTTIIINFPRLLFDSCCHKDEMMYNVRCGN